MAKGKDKRIGKFYRFSFDGCAFKTDGIMLASNAHYTLVKTFSDFVPDGFSLLRNKQMHFEIDDHAKMAAKILRLKKYTIANEPEFPFDTLDRMLKYISDKYKLMALHTANNKGFDVVKYNRLLGDSYRFRELTTLAKWRYELELPEEECRFISFDTNYLNGFKLVTQF